MKLVLAMMKHETNTFSPIVTDWERFESWGLYTGQAAIDAYGKTNMPLGVYLKLARDYGAEVVLPMAAEAMPGGLVTADRSEEHTSELQSLMRISYAVFCLKKKNIEQPKTTIDTQQQCITIKK